MSGLRSVGNYGKLINHRLKAPIFVTSNISKLESRIVQQATAVSQSSRSIEEILGRITAVSGILGENSTLMDTLLSASETGRGGIQKVTEIMNLR